MNLDPRTIILINVFVTLTVGLSMIAFSKSHLKEIPSIRQWAYATLLQTAGWTMIAFRYSLHEFFSVIIGNTLLILSIAMYFHVFANFGRKHANSSWAFVLIGILFIALTYYTLRPDVGMRFGITSISASILMIASGRLLFITYIKANANKFTGYVFIVCGLILGARGFYYIFLNTDPEPSLFDKSLIQDISQLTMNMSSILFTYGFLLVCTDHYINNLKEIEKEVTITKNNLTEAQNIASIGSWEYDAKTKKITWSDQHYILNGKSKENFIVTLDNHLDQIKQEDKDLFQKLIRKSLEQQRGFSLDHEIVRPDGSTIMAHTQGKVVTDRHGKIERIVGTTQDITARKMAEKKLAEERVLLRTIIDNIPVNIYVKNIHYQKVLANRSEVEFTGSPDEEFLFGKTDEELYDPATADHAMEEDKLVLQGTSIIEKESFTIRKDGGKVWLLLSKIPLRNEKNEIIGIVGISIDITARKRAEEEIRALNKTKDKFFSIVAHDLRSPITSLKSFSDFLVNHVAQISQEQVIEMSKDLSVSLENTIKTTDNLIVWARLQMEGGTTRNEKIDLNELIESVLAFYKSPAQQKQIDLSYFTKDHHVIAGDPNQITFIIRNLVNNAIKFTRKNGSVSINAYQNGGKVEVTVADTGVGIEKEHLDKLFAIREGRSIRGTEGEPGTGIGLMLVHEFIKLNGGDIRVESRLGNGTTVYVSLQSA